jgi:hypothetical protein
MTSSGKEQWLGTVAEIKTPYRKRIAVTFGDLSVDDKKLMATMITTNGSSETYTASADLFFNAQNTFNAVGDTIHTKKIIYISPTKIVFLVLVNGSVLCVLKCALCIVPDSFTYFSGYKTLIQHEVEGFNLLDKQVKNQFVNIYAYGNLWIGEKGFLLAPTMEIILMQYLENGSLLKNIQYYYERKKFDDIFTIWASAFALLFNLHSMNVVHGDSHLGNICSTNQSYIWIDAERLILRKNLSNTTWNTLKLMDVFVLLFMGPHVRNSFLAGIEQKDLIDFREKMGVDKCLILPNSVYANRLFVFNDKSCKVLNSMFSSAIDHNFLANGDIWQNTTLSSLRNAQNLKKFILGCQQALRTTKSKQRDNFSRARYLSFLESDREVVPVAYKSGRDAVPVTKELLDLSGNATFNRSGNQFFFYWNDKGNPIVFFEDRQRKKHFVSKGEITLYYNLRSNQVLMYAGSFDVTDTSIGFTQKNGSIIEKRQTATRPSI